MPITGHEKQRAALKRLYENNRIPHALLLCGISGIGKRLVARELCRSFYCSQGQYYGGCRNCEECSRFDLGNTPDYIELDCQDKERWKTQAIKELLSRLSLRSFSGSRFVVFENAEFMPTPAANALLKSLEEPRPGTFFILIASGTQKIVPTIVSRCQKWFFEPLSDAAMLEVLREKGFSEKETEELITLCEGSLEHLSEFSDNLGTWREIKQTIIKIGAGDEALALKFASSYARDKGRLSSDFGLMSVCARIMLHSSKQAIDQKKWAAYLANIVEAKKLIFERHFSPVNLLSIIHSNLALTGRVSGSPAEPIWHPLYISEMNL